MRSYQEEVVNRLNNLGKGFIANKLGNVVFENINYPLYAVTAKSPNPKVENVFISAGIHGDEPAALYALLEFLEKQVYNYIPYFNFYALPCLNPSGFENDTRENLNKVNLNKNFFKKKPEQEVILTKRFLAKGPKKYLFAVNMHEDPFDKPEEECPEEEPPRKFYLYEVSLNKESSIGHKIIEELENKGIEICKRKKIYYGKNENGLIWSKSTKYMFKGELEEHLQKYTKRILIPETSTNWSLENRIKIHILLLDITLNTLKNRL